MPKRRKKKRWSYIAGEKGRNWVRAYADARDGALYLEWYEQRTDPETGELLFVDGKPVMRRARASLKGITDTAVAAQRADKLAAEFAEEGPVEPAAISLSRLIRLYLREVTPHKGASKQGHDRAASRLFLAFFEGQPELARRSTRHPRTLDRIDWDRFVLARRAGRIPGFGKVRNRQIAYDLKFLVALLNWATGAKGAGGAPYLDRNPWGADVRRVQKWPMPKELNQHQPAMTDEIREQLIAHDGHWEFAAILRIQRHTRRRSNAVRQFVWSDLDMEARTITWRGEADKRGRANVTTMPDEVYEVLRALPVRGIGVTPVFPSRRSPDRPVPRNTLQIWLRRAKSRLYRSIDDAAQLADVKAQLRGVGFHAEKRAGVRDPEFRSLPPRIQEEVSGTSFETLRKIYDAPTIEDIRTAQQDARRRAAR